MTKQEQFLWIVQTAILANAINLVSRPDAPERYRNVYSAGGASGIMAEAIEASEMIPDEMPVRDAADDFCSWSLDNLRDEAERGSEGAEPPAWFVHY